MIELNFVAGGEIMGLQIDEKNICIRGKLSNYSWIDIRDLTEKEQDQVNKKHGVGWSKEYCDALDLRNNMTEDEMANDLVKDMQKSGWRLVKKTCS